MLANSGTKFFHPIIKKKKNSCTAIPSLINADGSCTTSQEEVVLEFVNFLKDLLGKDQNVTPISAYIIAKGLVLSEDDISFLSSPIDDV